MASTMDAIVQVGKNSVNESVVFSLNEALTARELVKVKVLKNCLDELSEVAEALAEASGAELVQIIGREQATKLIGRYGGTTLYIPTCRQAFVDTRDRNINLERDELAREGLSERALVSVLAVRHGLSDRQIWRILKKSGPVRPDMAACAAARRVSRSSARC